MSGGKWTAAAVVILAIAVVSAAAFYLGTRSSQASRFDTSAIVMQIKPLHQLATVRYSIQRVIGVREAKQPFGEESLLLMVQGDVLAGVDLADFTGKDVQFLNAHTVAIHLPAPTVLEAFLDEKNTKVWDRQITWWTPWVRADPDLEHRTRLSAIDEIKKTAISQGILTQAQKNAQIAVKAFLGALRLNVKFEGS